MNVKVFYFGSSLCLVGFILLFCSVFFKPEEQQQEPRLEWINVETVQRTETPTLNQVPTPTSLYTFGPNNDPGVCPADLNMRDYGPPDFNYPVGALRKMREGGPFPIISSHYLRAVSEGWPDGHYPL